jgi:hypothetical protein
MNSGRDPFGFEPSAGGYSPRPLTVIAEPGQEVRIVVPDRTGALPGFSADSGSDSPSGDPDSGSDSPSGDPDSGSDSPSADPDSGSDSPSGDPDLEASAAFGFEPAAAGFSPRPMTIVAQPGQELRIVVPDARGRIAGYRTWDADSGSDSPSGDPDAW